MTLQMRKLSSSVENPELTKVLLLKKWSRPEYIHACFDHCWEFLSSPNCAFLSHFFSSSSVSQASLDREDGMFEVCVWCNVMCLRACVCDGFICVCVCVDKSVCEGVV